MDPEGSQTAVEMNGGDSHKTMLLTLSISIIALLVLGMSIFVLVKKKQIKPVNYTNPFSSRLQTTSQNPFVKPTAAFQNPFTRPQTQTANKQYQNPFGGGQ